MSSMILTTTQLVVLVAMLGGLLRVRSAQLLAVPLELPVLPLDLSMVPLHPGI
ncbi:MAG: hypothetical protein WA964_17215 [Ilumatobacter sp.]|uniref:hypothetical protein n=1 Tax=Ilumatobacter sp. TaxID=1967498 RepID=UPI003C7453AA